MKKQTYSLLSLILLLTYSQTLKPAQYHALKKIPALALSAACSLFQVGNVISPLALNILFERPALKKASLEYVSSEASDEVAEFVNKIAVKRGLSPVYTQLYSQDFTSESINRIVFISPSISEHLSHLLSKPDLTTEEKSILNKYKGNIHHELTHIQYNDSLNFNTGERSIGALAGLTSLGITYAATKKIAPSILHNTVTKNLYYKTLTGLVAGKITDYTISCNIFSKYGEFRADKGIPNKKELLIPLIKELENLHQEDALKRITGLQKTSSPEFLGILYRRNVESRQTISTLQLCCIRYLLPSSLHNNGPLMTILHNGKLTHPADIHRANLFRARLEKLENAEQE
jgi:hypothetical protein